MKTGTLEESLDHCLLCFVCLLFSCTRHQNRWEAKRGKKGGNLDFFRVFARPPKRSQILNFDLGGEGGKVPLETGLAATKNNSKNTRMSLGRGTQLSCPTVHFSWGPFLFSQWIDWSCVASKTHVLIYAAEQVLFLCGCISVHIDPPK